MKKFNIFILDMPQKQNGTKLFFKPKLKLKLRLLNCLPVRLMHTAFLPRILDTFHYVTSTDYIYFAGNVLSLDRVAT